jgi:hypothetical protein
MESRDRAWATALTRGCLATLTATRDRSGRSTIATRAPDEPDAPTRSVLPWKASNLEQDASTVGPLKLRGAPQDVPRALRKRSAFRRSWVKAAVNPMAFLASNTTCWTSRRVRSVPSTMISSTRPLWFA